MNKKDFPPDALSRRGFLKLSTSASLALSGLTLGASLVGCAPAPSRPQGFAFLREADLELFRALIPAVVGPHLPTAAEARTASIEAILARIDATGARCEPPAQKALGDLFNLLNMSLTRRLTTGLTTRWSEAAPAEMDAFLNRWRSSNTALFNAAYRALARFIGVSFYGLPQAWAAVGYAGPQAAVYQVANA